MAAALLGALVVLANFLVVLVAIVGLNRLFRFQYDEDEYQRPAR
jgi:hypothetical protein